MDLQIKNKIAFIAGSTKGLGFATARQLLSEGATVVINGRSDESLADAVNKLEKIENGTLFTFKGDVKEERFANDLKAFLDLKLGGLDILITNAGGPPAGGIDDFSIAEWEEAINLSFLSHLRLISALIPLLRKSNHASILTVTSAAVKEPMPNLILSNTVRASTVGLTKSLANELGTDGIRVNSILPGWTSTKRVDFLMQARAEKNSTSSSDEVVNITNAIPLQRMGEPEEFARAAAFLVSPAASYITGVMLEVDGGLNKGLL